MKTYRALRMLRGDYGPDMTPKTVQPGEQFTVQDFQAKRMRHLEEKGLVERVVARPAVYAKSIMAYQNKSFRAPLSK